MTSPVFSQIQHAWARGSKGCKFGVEAGNVGVGVDNDDVVEVVKVEDKVEVEQELLEAELEAAAAASAAALAANAKAPFGSFLMFEVSNVWENNGLSKKHWDCEYDDQSSFLKRSNEVFEIFLNLIYVKW